MLVKIEELEEAMQEGERKTLYAVYSIEVSAENGEMSSREIFSQAGDIYPTYYDDYGEALKAYMKERHGVFYHNGLKRQTARYLEREIYEKTGAFLEPAGYYCVIHERA